MKYFVNIGGREIEVAVDGDQVSVAGRSMHAHLSPMPGTPLRHLLMDGRSVTLVLESRERGEWQVGLAGARYDAKVVDERTRHIQGLTAGAATQAGPAVLKAPMPGLVVRVLVVPGDQRGRRAGAGRARGDEDGERVTGSSRGHRPLGLRGSRDRRWRRAKSWSSFGTGLP